MLILKQSEEVEAMCHDQLAIAVVFRRYIVRSSLLSASSVLISFISI